MPIPRWLLVPILGPLFDLTQSGAILTASAHNYAMLAWSISLRGGMLQRVNDAGDGWDTDTRLGGSCH